MQAYIRNGWANNVIDPDGNSSPVFKDSPHIDVLSTLPDNKNDSWSSLKDADENTLQLLSFTNAQIINYFVVRTAVDGTPASDMKAINSSALNLFKCGHIQNIQICIDKYLYVTSKCVPEMRKDRIYKLRLVLDLLSLDIIGAECGCPAGKGPCASCKHICALCYAIEEFSRLKKIPDFLTCTDKLQQWNRPRPKKLEVIPVTSLSSRRRKIMNKKKSLQICTFDPRPLEHRQIRSRGIEKLRCDLLQLNQSFAFSDVLVPLLDNITHDHTTHCHQQLRMLTEEYL